MSEQLRGAKALVTGAGGFIGSHLVERLLDYDVKVRAFVRYTSRADLGLLRLLPDENLQQLEIMAGDLRDSSAVLDAMEDVDYVFHLGALVAIPYSYLHPREVAETNIIGTLNVLEAARRKRPNRVLHTSTSEVYGTAQFVPIDESHPLQGQSPYSASKIAADKLAESYFRSFEIPVVTVRPFNTFGPRQSSRAVIPTIITQALTSDTITLGALDPTRDFTFVTDTVEGFVAAAVADPELILGREINLGTNEEISVGDLAVQIQQIIGRKVEIQSDQQRLRPVASEVSRLNSDNRLARELLGWSPKVTLDEGLRATVAWIRDHLGMYRVGVYEV